MHLLAAASIWNESLCVVANAIANHNPRRICLWAVNHEGEKAEIQLLCNQVFTIKGWIDGCEKFLLKHKNIIKKKFIEATSGRVPKSSIYGWNELVIYDIKVKGALVVLDGLARPGDYEELEKNLEHTEKIVKKYTNNIQRGFMSDDVVRKYILKHGGKIGSLDPKQIKIRMK